MIFLIGPSGSAKSTSVRMIADMLNFDILDTKYFDRKVRGEMFKNLVSMGNDPHLEESEIYGWSSEFERTTYTRVFLTMIDHCLN